jgi:hypothetical protein
MRIDDRRAWCIAIRRGAGATQSTSVLVYAGVGLRSGQSYADASDDRRCATRPTTPITSDAEEVIDGALSPLPELAAKPYRADVSPVLRWIRACLDRLAAPTPDGHTGYAQLAQFYLLRLAALADALRVHPVRRSMAAQALLDNNNG